MEEQQNIKDIKDTKNVEDIKEQDKSQKKEKKKKDTKKAIIIAIILILLAIGFGTGTFQKIYDLILHRIQNPITTEELNIMLIQANKLHRLKLLNLEIRLY